MTEPKYILLGIASVLFFTVSGLFIFANVNQSGSLASDSDYKMFNSSFQKIDEFNSGVSGIRSSVDTSESSGLFDKVGLIESLVNQAWNSLKLLLSSFGFLSTMFSDTAVMFGIPAFVVTLGTLAVTIVLVFGILYIIFNRA